MMHFLTSQQAGILGKFGQKNRTTVIAKIPADANSAGSTMAPEMEKLYSCEQIF